MAHQFSAAVFLSVLGQLRNENAFGCTCFAQCLRERPGILLDRNCAVVSFPRFVLS